MMFMNPEDETLLHVSDDDIDWESVKGLDGDYIRRIKARNAHFPTNIRGFHNGIAEVEWQVSPDGMYYMDDDGFGMSDDEEISLFGYVNRAGDVVAPFTFVGYSGSRNYDKLESVKKSAKSRANLNKLQNEKCEPTNINLTMKRNVKITAWSIAAVLILLACAFGGFALKDYLYERFYPPFEQTTIFPDDTRDNPADTTFTVNGVDIKMIGVRGGKICCKDDKDTVKLHDFYIGETEVTQELWMSVMGDNPSGHKDKILSPVTNIDLVECLEFVHKLDSVSGLKFYVPFYHEWVYAALLGNGVYDSSCCIGNTSDSVCWHKGNSGSTTHLVKQKKPNALGIYDMFGNVSEWTLGGSDPLFFVPGGSYEDEKGQCNVSFDIYHAKVKMGSLGLRLVCYPASPKEMKN